MGHRGRPIHSPMINLMRLLEDDVRTVWDPQRFSTSGRLPVVVGTVNPVGEEPGRDSPVQAPVEASVDSPREGTSLLPSCLDMLVKMPGEENLTIPNPWAESPVIGEVLAECLRFEREHDWGRDRFAYLTVDHRVVPAGRTHRNRGWHFDGMQGARYQVKLPACYQYVWSSAESTEFSSVPVSAVGLSESGDNWFHALGGQIPAAFPPVRFPAGMIVVMSAYQLHRSPEVGVPTRRLFVRLDYSLKEQDRLGNTVNPLLPAPWVFRERSLPEGLVGVVDDAGWDSGSFE